MPPTVAELCTDLAAEHAALDDVVAGLPAAAWATATPAAGWDVRDSISHLCFFDESATLALTDPDGFETHKGLLVAAMAEVAAAGPSAGTPDVVLGRELPSPGALLDRWRAGRAAYLDAAAASAAADPGRRIPWYGPPMSVASFTTARLMETWAHGADIRDALGEPIDASPRLRHIVHIGVTARPYAFAVHGVTDPGETFRVEAAAPDGTTWTWGPPEAPDRVTGSALDLALVLTQRRHRSHTGVTVEGPVAEQWLAIAQAFAGPPTITDPGR
jgi:uncharacterized protein (TIGR03084 family)